MPPKLIAKKRKRKSMPKPKGKTAMLGSIGQKRMVKTETTKKGPVVRNVINVMTPVGRPTPRPKIATYSERVTPVATKKLQSELRDVERALFDPSNVQVRAIQRKLFEEKEDKMTNHEKQFIKQKQKQEFDNSIRGIAKREGIQRYSRDLTTQQRYLLKHLPAEFRDLTDFKDKRKTETIYRLFTSFVNDQHFDKGSNPRFRQLNTKLMQELGKINSESARDLVLGAIKKSANQFVQDFVDDEVRDVPVETMVNPLDVEQEVFVPARRVPPPMTETIEVPSKITGYEKHAILSGISGSLQRRGRHFEEIAEPEVPILRPEPVLVPRRESRMPTAREYEMAKTVLLQSQTDPEGPYIRVSSPGELAVEATEDPQTEKIIAQDYEQMEGQGRRRRRNLRGHNLKGCAKSKPKTKPFSKMNQSKLPNYYYY